MPSITGMFDSLHIFLDRYGRQLRIWKMERECGMDYSLSWWGFRPEYDEIENIEEMERHFEWNERKRRWEDGIFPGS